MNIELSRREMFVQYVANELVILTGIAILLFVPTVILVVYLVAIGAPIGMLVMIAIFSIAIFGFVSIPALIYFSYKNRVFKKHYLRNKLHQVAGASPGQRHEPVVFMNDNPLKKPLYEFIRFKLFEVRIDEKKRYFLRSKKYNELISDKTKIKLLEVDRQMMVLATIECGSEH